jgi:hypothetical protein
LTCLDTNFDGKIISFLASAGRLVLSGYQVKFRMKRFTSRSMLVLGVLGTALSARAQGSPAATAGYSRLNTFSTFFEYANDSSHIILGQAENRKIGAIGFQYERRVLHRRWLDLGYTAELRPAMLESDPTETVTVVATAPAPASYSEEIGATLRCAAVKIPYSYTESGPGQPPVTTSGYDELQCGRRMVVEQGLSPAGLRLHLRPGHRLQPTLSTFAGYMFSSQPVPVAGSGSFNFTFEFGGGLEWFLRRGSAHSVRLEYQVQHFSNKDTATNNPGVDSGLVKLTYAFGR